MPKPKDENPKQTVSTRIDDRVLAKIKKLAKTDKRSVSYMVNELTTEALKKRKLI